MRDSCVHPGRRSEHAEHAEIGIERGPDPCRCGGNRLRTLREAANLTQKELADALSVSVRSVQAWEAGTSVPQARHRRQSGRVLLGLRGRAPRRKFIQSARWSAASRHRRKARRKDEATQSAEGFRVRCGPSARRCCNRGCGCNARFGHRPPREPTSPVLPRAVIRTRRLPPPRTAPGEGPDVGRPSRARSPDSAACASTFAAAPIPAATFQHLSATLARSAFGTIQGERCRPGQNRSPWTSVGPSKAEYPDVLTFFGADYTAVGRTTALAIRQPCSAENCTLFARRGRRRHLAHEQRPSGPRARKTGSSSPARSDRTRSAS